MKSKFIEIRDRATRIDVLATKMASRDQVEAHYLRHSGYGDPSTSTLVLLVRLNDNKAAYGPYQWDASTRTMREAHKYIEEHFDMLHTGDVVDVAFVLGETDAPKLAERLEWRF